MLNTLSVQNRNNVMWVLRNVVLGIFLQGPKNPAKFGLSRILPIMNCSVPINQMKEVPE